MKGKIPMVRSVSLFIGCLVVLSACTTTHQVSDDYGAEFIGTYHVTERSTEKLMPMEYIRLDRAGTGATIITFETATERGKRSATCHSILGPMYRSVQSANPDESFHGYECWDEYGALWQFVHAKPGSRTTMPLANRLSRQEVTTQSGYILFIGIRGLPSLHYALIPEIHP